MGTLTKAELDKIIVLMDESAATYETVATGLDQVGQNIAAQGLRSIAVAARIMATELRKAELLERKPTEGIPP